MKKRDVLRLTCEKLAELINLREDHCIANVVQTSNDILTNSVSLVIEGPTCTEMHDGMVPYPIRIEDVPTKDC